MDTNVILVCNGNDNNRTTDIIYSFISFVDTHVESQNARWEQKVSVEDIPGHLRNNRVKLSSCEPSLNLVVDPVGRPAEL